MSWTTDLSFQPVTVKVVLALNPYIQAYGLLWLSKVTGY